ncbi:hypothetical protein EDC04DRAFT_2573522, partial [Pisolithus marmoratus]
PPLLYNICSLFIAYAYVARHLSVPPLSSPGNSGKDKREARRLITRVVAFIADRESKTLHVSSTNAVKDVWARLGLWWSIESRTISLLLCDVSRLIRPQKVVVAEDTVSRATPAHSPLSAHLCADTRRVVSDMYALLDEDGTENGQRKKNYLLLKIVFYAGHILAAPSLLPDALVDEVFLRSKSTDDEGKFANMVTHPGWREGRECRSRQPTSLCLLILA